MKENYCSPIRCMSLWIRWNQTKDNRKRESFELHDTYLQLLFSCFKFQIKDDVRETSIVNAKRRRYEWKL